jgi:hypothetical protein
LHFEVVQPRLEDLAVGSFLGKLSPQRCVFSFEFVDARVVRDWSSRRSLLDQSKL